MRIRPIVEMGAWRSAIRQLLKIGWLTGISVDKSPDTRGMTIGRAIGTIDGEMAIGKLPIKAVYPRFYNEVISRMRHLLHFYD